jgi:hypothetical protein
MSGPIFILFVHIRTDHLKYLKKPPQELQPKMTILQKHPPATSHTLHQLPLHNPTLPLSQRQSLHQLSPFHGHLSKLLSRVIPRRKQEQDWGAGARIVVELGEVWAGGL